MTTMTPELTETQRADIETMNVSDSIRYLDEAGYPRAEIARALGKRYQHVRNVLERTNKKGGQKKTTFTLRSSAFQEFDRLVAKIGLRRDSYLNGLLETAVDALAQHPPNSPETEELLKAYYRSDPSQMLAHDELTRVNIKLDETLVKAMKQACVNAKLPRDLFLDGVLEVAVAALAQAEQSISDPIYFCNTQGQTFCGNYLLSDDDAARLRASMDEEVLTIQAVAMIKDISFNAASRSFAILSPEDRRNVMAHPETRQVIDKLKETSKTIVSLEDLM